MISRNLPKILFFLLFLPIFVGAAHAQTAPKAIIAVIDMQKIMRDLSVVNDLNAQIKTFEEKINADLTAEENKLKDERKQIERQKTLVTPEAYSEKQAAFNRKAAAFRRQVQEKNRQLQISRVKALDEVRAQMLPIVRQVMNDYGATMVVDVQEVLYAEKPLEITDNVIERLNKDLKKIKVELVPLKKS